MGILSRFKDIMASNINALLDKAEDPEKMMIGIVSRLTDQKGFDLVAHVFEELCEDDIPVTVITDGMAAWTMKTKGINAVVVGADRIAANGDTANKIGTYGVALAAKAHGVPFYIAAPTSTFDFTLTSGEQIPIEERSADEVKRFRSEVTAPDKALTFNPSFDVTPAELIAGIITEYGVVTAPYVENIKLLQEKMKEDL